ncbi:DNA polymerase III subunit delta' [Acinetobacter gyllenbergii]|uniref:DNA-directed DNA polymerase n=1 Tax=Acinetobacter gyllenbergii CIP 110306 = MTCC 11365 TaxID=1217657 RepID=A0A829HGD0_9GAMM|nr:DNA polymerase III delta prime subunit [Acinetobacter gyllenbergii]EPF83481.1 DNA polymerase III, delta' subunit [Acinetobacter gyllenbergii CIP 110306 = MTCC 11365]EPH35556.1 DNA polymerase III delta prime subunit [Acinetobacter gyllenbergii CIP 110306 = MTCC 11365]ESK57702.1 DNA polymerase III, delta' subunit [Acinetobacter gyllenbergii NIPH 230]MCU4581438.1 DNA polymerase III subunit delta' [Acinetobacter gyllenbergii]OBY75425.1 DNA polymerase III subunit delta' [Acinetobacter gyllenberg
MVDTQSTVIYPWHAQTWELLTTRFPELGHGLLFYGKKGCAKQEFAERFVAWVLCLNKQAQRACGECTSCQWLKSDTHPNYVHITTDEDNKKQNAKIKIEKIRDLLPFVQQTGEGWRVVVIEPAEALNTASANALLKTLEEPGEKVVLILLADHYLKLPATIRSRLQHFALDRLTIQEAQTFVQQQIPEINAEQVSLLLNLANDMPLTAIEIEKSEWLQKRALFLNDWFKLVAEKNMPLNYSNKWSKELNFSELITMFEYLLGDLISLKLNQSLKNDDLDFKALAEFYSLEALFTIYSDLQQKKLMIEQNVQTQLVLDELFIQLMNVA